MMENVQLSEESNQESRDIEPFFAKKEIQEAIQKSLVGINILKVSREATLNTDLRDVLSANETILSFMQQNPSDWDEYCQFNINHVGSQLSNKLDDLTKNGSSIFNTESPASVLVFLCRFLKEYQLNSGTGHLQDGSLSNILDKMMNKSYKISVDQHTQLVYVLYEMPAAILKDRLNTLQARMSAPEIINLQTFKETLVEADMLKKEWDNSLEAREAKVQELTGILKKHETAFNFVGLDSAFQALERKKQLGYHLSQFVLTILAMIILGVLVLEAKIIWDAIQNNQLYINSIENGSRDVLLHKIELADYAYLIFPTLAIEIILIYFFRVVLSNYNSIKAQILQIELRRSLCQFIQSYADYAKEINDKSAGTLERFEQIIFSGIVSDPDKVTTYDGIESLANMVKAIKG